MKRYLRKKVLYLAFGIAQIFWFGGVLTAQTSSNGNTSVPPQTQVTGDIYGQINVIGDVDGDGVKDVIFGATDGKVHIYSSATGKEIVRPPYWPKQTGGPILADVQVTSFCGGIDIIAASQDGKVYCLDSLGKEKWVVDTRGKITISGAELADVEGNGKLEVLIGSESGKVFRIDAAGNPIWEVSTTGSVSGRIAARDLDGDGKKEIIFKGNDGKVTVLNHTGTARAGWPANVAGNREWPFDVDAGDIDGDGVKEVFTTTPSGNFLIWNDKGKMVKNFSLPSGSHSAPILADIDNTGTDEFVIAHYDGKVTICDFTGKPKPGWPYDAGNHSIYAAPVIIDIDGDGKLDVVFTASNPSGSGQMAGYVMALDSNGKPLKDFPKYVGRTVGRPTFADLDGDGKLEMIIGGGIGYTGKQLHIIPTEARTRFRMISIYQETVYK
ncbi:MAG: FG-GAP-like repeat-containing protein [Candidatus Ozemobacteraceae bacterium]